MNTCMMEHRWGDRVSVDIPVKLIGPARTVLAGRLTNFSASGAFVEFSIYLPIMTNITVIIQSMNPVPKRLKAIAGYVVRHDQGGIGVGWWKIAPVSVAHVLAIHEALRPRSESLHQSRMHY